MNEETREFLEELRGLSQEDLESRLTSLARRDARVILRKNNFKNISFDEVVKAFPQIIDIYYEHSKEALFLRITDPALIKDDKLREEFFEYNKSLLDMDALMFVTNEDIKRAKESKYIEKISATIIVTIAENTDEKIPTIEVIAPPTPVINTFAAFCIVSAQLIAPFCNIVKLSCGIKSCDTFCSNQERPLPTAFTTPSTKICTQEINSGKII